MIKYLLKFLFMGFLCQSLSFRVHAQIKNSCVQMPTAYPKPNMWSDKYTGMNKILDFKSIKLKSMTKLRGKGVILNSEFNLGNFIGFLKYVLTKGQNLRIYFGRFSDEGQDNVPEGDGGQLTLIFSPANCVGQDIDKTKFYFFPPNKPFDEADLLSFTIDQTTKDKWIKNYYQIMPLNTIDPDNNENVCQGCLNPNDKTPSDTKSVLYLGVNLKEIINEQIYCHYDAITKEKINFSTTFKAFLATEDKPCISCNSKKKNYRIILDFDYTDLDGQIVYLEDTDGWIGRGKPISTIDPSCPPTALDNGQLCPTICN